MLTPETIKLLGGTKNKIAKDKNNESLSHLEITKVILVYYNLINNNYQENSRVFYKSFLNKSFVILEISSKNIFTNL